MKKLKAKEPVGVTLISKMPIYKVGEKYYVLNERHWNGEKWLGCWRCRKGRNHFVNVESDTTKYTLRPIHRYQIENINLDEIEENSDEWDEALEIVDFEVSS